MTDDSSSGARAAVLAAMLVLSVVAGTVAFSGAAAAADVETIEPNDHTAKESGVTYTVNGTVNNFTDSEELQHIVVWLDNADVSSVSGNEVSVFINGTEYTDGYSQFDATNGTVDFKLSNSRDIDSPETVRVEIAQVTNPSDDFTARASFNETADASRDTFSDTVNITDGIVYEDMQVNRSTVGTGKDVQVSATVRNEGTDSATYEATFYTDGSKTDTQSGTLASGESETVSFVTSFDTTGDHTVSIEELGPATITVTEPVAISAGVAAPSHVATGETVSNQQVSVQLRRVSADGDTDTHYVVFPDALAGNLSVNFASVDGGGASIAQNAELVDGYDDDGRDDTVKFQTDADGGGLIDPTVTVDVSVGYPATEREYDVDARVVDSSTGTDTAVGVATITASESTSDTGANVGGTSDCDTSLMAVGDERAAASDWIGVDDRAHVCFGAEVDVRAVTVAVPPDLDGEAEIAVVEPSSEPVEQLEGTVVSVVTVDLPKPADNGSITVRVTIPSDEIDVPPERLRLVHERSDGWHRLNTSVTNSSAVTITATAPHASAFAVTAVDESGQSDVTTPTPTATPTPTPTATPTPTPTPTATPTPTPTESSGPGFGATVAVVALLAAALLARRR